MNQHQNVFERWYDLYRKSSRELEEARQIDHFSLSEENTSLVDYLLENSRDLNSFLIDKETLFLLDLSLIEAVPYQSIVLQSNGQLYKVRADTNDLIKEFEDFHQWPYHFSKKIGENLGYKQKIPYICADMILMPNRGPSKSPASWIALHHVLRTHYVAEEDLMYFMTSQDLHFSFPISQHVFKEQLQKSCQIYNTQRIIIQQIVGMLESTSLTRRRHIVDESLIKMGFHASNLTFYDLLEHATQFEVQKHLQLILGEGNPYLDDFQNLFYLSSLDSKDILDHLEPNFE